MRVAIMQPYLFPYLGYFQLIHSADKFIIYDDVNYINRGWINRNNILLNNKPFLINIPLKEASQNRLISEIEVLGDKIWRNKILKTLEQAYKKAPYFNEIFPILNEVFFSEEIFVSDLILYSLKLISKKMGLTCQFVNSSKIYNNAELKGQFRILDICKQESANVYINPIGGVEIYDKEIFRKEEVDLKFIKTNKIIYKQFKNEFVSNLSIIDVLMFNSEKEINTLLGEYELI